MGIKISLVRPGDDPVDKNTWLINLAIWVWSPDPHKSGNRDSTKLFPDHHMCAVAWVTSHHVCAYKYHDN